MQAIPAYSLNLAKVDLLYCLCQSGSPAGGLYENVNQKGLQTMANKPVKKTADSTSFKIGDRGESRDGIHGSAGQEREVPTR